MNCFIQNIAILPIGKGKGMTENKGCINLSKHLGDEVTALFKVNGARQNITAGFRSGVWEHEPWFLVKPEKQCKAGELSATRCLEGCFL